VGHGPDGWCQARVEAAAGSAIRFWLDRERRLRDRAVFDFATASELRGCDVVTATIGGLVSGGRVRSHATAVQRKTDRFVQFELLDPNRGRIQAWPEHRGGTLDEFVFRSLMSSSTSVVEDPYATVGSDELRPRRPFKPG
jgi:hypothetical protein